ncbi:MAG: DUF4164 domain-containing protein [Pseudorhodoplanes sp.]
MSDPSAIDAATKRLSVALDALEAAVDRRRESDGETEALTEQLHKLSTDRSRLASDLDAAAARSRQLEGTNRDVARRLEVAMGTIQSVLDTHDR